MFVRKEDGFDVGVVHAHVFHTVFFFVAAGQFVFLDFTLHIVLEVGGYYQSVLRSVAHRLRVDIVAFFLVLN